jgi:hypothetical protein
MQEYHTACLDCGRGVRFSYKRICDSKLTKTSRALLLDIRKMTASLNETTDLVNENVVKLLTRIESSELGMLLLHLLVPKTYQHRRSIEGSHALARSSKSMGLS